MVRTNHFRSVSYTHLALPQYVPLIDEAITYAKAQSADKAQQLIDAEDKLAVNIGLEILKIVPGRISTEVDARLSYDTQATVEKARKMCIRDRATRKLMRIAVNQVR